MKQSQSLFNIQSEYVALMDVLLENGGELTPEIESQLAINKQDLQTKGINYGVMIKKFDSDCDIIDKEIERLKKIRSYREKSSDRLKGSLKNAMELFEVSKIESPLLTVSLSKSESVEIENEDLIHKRFIKEKTETSIDKKAIKDAIKKGEIVPGASIKSNKNIQIK